MRGFLLSPAGGSRRLKCKHVKSCSDEAQDDLVPSPTETGVPPTRQRSPAGGTRTRTTQTPTAKPHSCLVSVFSDWATKCPSGGWLFSGVATWPLSGLAPWCKGALGSSALRKRGGKRVGWLSNGTGKGGRCQARRMLPKRTHVANRGNRPCSVVARCVCVCAVCPPSLFLRMDAQFVLLFLCNQSSSGGSQSTGAEQVLRA